MRFPWKRCDWYLVFAGIASPALPPTVERCLRNHQTTFRVRGRYSRRESANRGPWYAATSSKLEPCCLMGARIARPGTNRGDKSWLLSSCANSVSWAAQTSLQSSILETAWLATYSLLRRKKSLALSGDIPFHARGVREQARRAELFLIHYWGQGTYGSLASLPQTEERA